MDDFYARSSGVSSSSSSSVARTAMTAIDYPPMQDPRVLQPRCGEAEGERWPGRGGQRNTKANSQTFKRGGRLARAARAFFAISSSFRS